LKISEHKSKFITQQYASNLILVPIYLSTNNKTKLTATQTSDVEHYSTMQFENFVEVQY